MREHLSMPVSVSMNICKYKCEHLCVLSMLMCNSESLFVYEWIRVFISECVSSHMYGSMFMCVDYCMIKLVCVKVLMYNYFSWVELNV